MKSLENRSDDATQAWFMEWLEQSGEINVCTTYTRRSAFFEKLVKRLSGRKIPYTLRTISGVQVAEQGMTLTPALIQKIKEEGKLIELIMQMCYNN